MLAQLPEVLTTGAHVVTHFTGAITHVFQLIQSTEWKEQKWQGDSASAGKPSEEKQVIRDRDTTDDVRNYLSIFRGERAHL